MFFKNILYVFGSFFFIRTINKKIEESIDAVIGLYLPWFTKANQWNLRDNNEFEDKPYELTLYAASMPLHLTEIRSFLFENISSHNA